MDLSLRHKTFLITGGSRGLGLALAERLLGEGAKVAVLARDEDRLHAAEARLAQFEEFFAVQGDVTRAADLTMLAESAQARWGRIDGVVNNAGTHAAGSFSEHDDERWRSDLELKLLAAIRLTKIALPALRESGGAVLNTLAISGKTPEALSTPSSVSRGAGLALTKALSRELGPQGVRVNAVLVGVAESDQLERLAERAGLAPAEYYARMVHEQRIPLGRVGRPDEFADLAAFLLSARASYISGAAVNLDGGLCLVP